MSTPNISSSPCFLPEQFVMELISREAKKLEDTRKKEGGLEKQEEQEKQDQRPQHVVNDVMVNSDSFLARILTPLQQKELIKMLYSVPDTQMNRLSSLMLPFYIEKKYEKWSSLKISGHLVAIVRSCMHPLAPDEAVLSEFRRFDHLLGHALDPWSLVSDKEERRSAFGEQERRVAVILKEFDGEWLERRLEGRHLSWIIVSYECRLESIDRNLELFRPLFSNVAEIEECLKMAGFCVPIPPRETLVQVLRESPFPY